MTWSRLFEDQDICEVEKRYEKEELPDVRNVLYGDVINKCWNEAFDSGKEVLECLKERQTVGSKAKGLTTWLILIFTRRVRLSIIREFLG